MNTKNLKRLALGAKREAGQKPEEQKQPEAA